MVVSCGVREFFSGLRCHFVCSIQFSKPAFFFYIFVPPKYEFPAGFGTNCPPGFVGLAGSCWPRGGGLQRSRPSTTALVEMLNDIFTCFDRLCLIHGVEKIKTIAGPDALVVFGPIIIPGFRASDFFRSVLASGFFFCPRKNFGRTDNPTDWSK